MRIKIRHEIVQRFDPSARRVIEALRLTPRSHEGQHVLEWRIDVEADCRLRRAEDAFGNLADMFSLQAPPSELRLVAEDKTTVFGSEAMISDFPLTDESLCYVTFGPEEAPGE